MTEREFYQEVEGRDKNGMSNAMISLSILYPNEEDVAEQRTFSTLDGAAYFAIMPDGLSMIDVMFENYTDFDYIQLGDVCEEYFNLLSEANSNGTEIPSLVLSIAPKGDFSSIMTAMNCVWSYIPVSATKMCSGIRFIVQTGNLNFLEMTEEQADAILDELDDEEFEGLFSEDDIEEV